MEQREPEDYRMRAARRADLHTQGIKGMFLLHGGGTLSLLTFETQLMLSKGNFSSLISWITAAIACFVFGLFVLAPVNHLRYESSRLYDKDSTKPLGKVYGFIHRALFYLSLALFAAGVILALVGMHCSNRAFEERTAPTEVRRTQAEAQQGTPADLPAAASQRQGGG